jgi:hypothetical protein
MNIDPLAKSATFLPDLKPKHNIANLSPGKVSLSRVPVYGDFLEVATPYYRDHTTVEVLIEDGLVEIRRADLQNFNVYNYRGSDYTSYQAFHAPVPSAILSSTDRGGWQIDGPGLKVDDLLAVYRFISIIGTFAIRKQQ